MEPLKVFIGYDGREPEAYDVCARSILDHATVPVSLTKLSQRALRHAGLYDRSYITDDAGHRIDTIDRRPFSTDFTFTRFLVPALCQYEGFALFIDSDFFFRHDIKDLFDSCYPSIHDHAVNVVKHNYKPTNKVKMDNQVQQVYNRKLWSAMMLYNCGHRSNLFLTPRMISEQSGNFLHNFQWLENREIGELPETWHYLPGSERVIEPGAVHFTEGIPTMPGYDDQEYADEWLATYHKEIGA